MNSWIFHEILWLASTNSCAVMSSINTTPHQQKKGKTANYVSFLCTFTEWEVIKTRGSLSTRRVAGVHTFLLANVRQPNCIGAVQGCWLTAAHSLQVEDRRETPRAANVRRDILLIPGLTNRLTLMCCSNWLETEVCQGGLLGASVSPLCQCV